MCVPASTVQRYDILFIPASDWPPLRPPAGYHTSPRMAFSAYAPAARFYGRAESRRLVIFLISFRFLFPLPLPSVGLSFVLLPPPHGASSSNEVSTAPAHGASSPEAAFATKKRRRKDMRDALSVMEEKEEASSSLSLFLLFFATFFLLFFFRSSTIAAWGLLLKRSVHHAGAWSLLPGSCVRYKKASTQRHARRSFGNGGERGGFFLTFFISPFLCYFLFSLFLSSFFISRGRLFFALQPFNFSILQFFNFSIFQFFNFSIFQFFALQLIAPVSRGRYPYADAGTPSS